MQRILRIKDKTCPEYFDLVEQLPTEFRDSYHVLIQKVAMYILMAQGARRGREGIDSLKKSHFEKKYDDELEYHYWHKVKGELTKNHRY